MENKEIEMYLAEVKKSIHKIAESDEFIDGLRQQLYDYADENPELSLDDLYKFFGDPDSIAKEFLDDKLTLQPKQLAKTKKSGALKTVIIIGLVIAIGIGLYHIYDISRQTQTMATDVIVIEE